MRAQLKNLPTEVIELIKRNILAKGMNLTKKGVN
jgi:hypothetical protein